MPHRLTLEPHFVRIELLGTIARPDLEAALADLETLERTMDRTPNRLTDLSGVIDRDLTANDIISIAARRKVTVLRNPIKSALVAPRPVSVGFSRMYQMLNEHPQIRIEVFDSVDAAVAWLVGR
jgi:hypothetical protein